MLCIEKFRNFAGVKVAVSSEPLIMKNIPTLLLLFCCGIISAQCPDFTNLAGSGVTCQYGSFNDPFQYTGVASGRHTVITQQGGDPYTGYQLPFLPAGESRVVKLGNERVGSEAEAITYQFTVNPDYAILLLKFAVVLEDPGHPAPAQPRFVVRVLNSAGQLVETCAEYDVTAAGDIPGFQTFTSGWYNVRWRPWTNVGIDLSDYAGQQIRLQFVTYDCDYWGHFGYAYFTASCMSNQLAMSGCNGSQVTLVAPSGFESYAWDNGSTSSSAIYTVNGTTTANCLITSATGCQFTLSGTISSQSGLPTTSTTVYDTICEGDTYMGHFFDLPAQWETGTHTRTRTMTTSGCSSNLTLQLKVNEPETSTFSATATGNYTWNGVTYYESGDYTQHFNSADGCDSVVTLRLTITEPLQFSIAATDDTICEGDEVTLQVVTAGSSSNFQVPPIAVGDILCTDGTTVKPADYANSGKTAMGVVFYVDNTGAHGWAVHLHYQHIGVEWTTPMSAFMDIPTLTNYSTSRTAINDFDGYNNTIKIRNAGNAATYPAAYAVDFGNGWYIPAAGQLRQLFNEIVEVRASLQIVGGDVLSLDSSHWSSTEAGSNNVWDVRDRGTVYRNSKHSMIRLRSVRSF